MNEIVLIVVAHSDDSRFQWRYTILVKKEAVYVVSMTDGVGARDNVDTDQIKHEKHRLIWPVRSGISVGRVLHS